MRGEVPESKKSDIYIITYSSEVTYLDRRPFGGFWAAAEAPRLVVQPEYSRPDAPTLASLGNGPTLYYKSQAVAPAALVQHGWSTGDCRFYV